MPCTSNNPHMTKYVIFRIWSQRELLYLGYSELSFDWELQHPSALAEDLRKQDFCIARDVANSKIESKNII